jgi:hypothetical protein
LGDARFALNERFQSSLRDGGAFGAPVPGVETPGYFRAFLRNLRIMNISVEVRGAHPSKTAKGGAHEQKQVPFDFAQGRLSLRRAGFGMTKIL